jgi:excisionase family DNA binding protein
MNQSTSGQSVPLPPLALTVAGASHYSGLSRSRLFALMKDGEIPSVLVGGRRMIFRSAVDGFFAKLLEAK